MHQLDSLSYIRKDTVEENLSIFTVLKGDNWQKKTHTL